MNFLADMGEAPPGKTLERKDTNGNYEPGNCIWADYVTQNNNQNRIKRYLVGGEWFSRAQLRRIWGTTETECARRVRDYPMMVNGVIVKTGVSEGEQYRASFEAYAAARGLRLERAEIGSGYARTETNEAWSAWAAAKSEAIIMSKGNV